MTKKVLFCLAASSLILSACVSPTVTRPATQEQPPTDTATRTASPTETDIVPLATHTPVPTFTREPVEPFPGAPPCPNHDDRAAHGLWDAARGCHYDHEHGKNPRNSALFPVLMQITDGQEISYAWQTPHENVKKHGGYKYDWRDGVECRGREGSPYGVSSYIVLRHGVGDYARAMGTPFHSYSGAVVICHVATGMDIGTLASGGWQSWGQRTAPYQGEILSFDYDGEYAMLGSYMSYDPAREPYISIDCVYSDCGRDLGSVGGKSTWISEPGNLFGNRLFSFLFRTRDAHSVVDGTTRFGTLEDLRFLFVCSDDGGSTFRPEDCSNNNSTGAVHEVVGTVPGEWDDLDGAPDGYVTYQGFTDRWGRLVEGCSTVGTDCVPLILRNVPVGRYGMQDHGPDRKPFDKQSLPDYDICFQSDGSVIPCEVGGAPSGWIGSSN